MAVSPDGLPLYPATRRLAPYQAAEVLIPTFLRFGGKIGWKLVTKCGWPNSTVFDVLGKMRAAGRVDNRGEPL